LLVVLARTLRHEKQHYVVLVFNLGIPSQQHYNEHIIVAEACVIVGDVLKARLSGTSNFFNPSSSTPQVFFTSITSARLRGMNDRRTIAISSHNKLTAAGSPKCVTFPQS
jgi:hypothetical protein